MIITSADAQTFTQWGVTAVGFASPSRGAKELSLWRLSLAPGHQAPPHSLTHEEVFLALAGSAVATIDGEDQAFGAGDCLVVPVGVPFTFTTGPEGLEAVCAMRAEGEATILPDGPTITPPWAA